MFRTERLAALSARSRLSLTRPQALVFACLLLGFASEALVHRARVGLNFSLLVALAGGLHAAFTATAAPARRRLLAALLPAAVSAPVFLLDSAWSRFFAIPASIGWLLLVPRLVEHGASLAIFGDVPARAGAAIARIAPAAARAIKLPGVALSSGRTGGGSLRPWLLGLGLGIPSALVFMILFSFDAKFSRAIAFVGRGSGDGGVFVMGAIAFAIGLGTMVGVEELRRANHAGPPPLPAGSDSEPYRVPPRPDPAPEIEIAAPPKAKLPPLAWTLVLFQVSAVFALYVGLHAGELFASHTYVRETPGVTYANQLHAGFIALLCATLLSASLVVLGHLVVREGRGLRGEPRSWALTTSEVLLIALTLPTLASCGQKLWLYVEAYGQTYLRLGVALVVLTAVPVLGLLAYRSLRPRFEGLGAACAAVTLAIASLAGFFDADAHVAQTNVERALRGKPLDGEYLGTLGSRVFVGYVRSRPESPEGQQRWREVLRTIEANEERPSSDLRGYRRTVRCAAMLGADCAELAPRAKDSWR